MGGPDEPRPTQFFERAFQVAPVAMLVVDAGGTIIELNTQLEALFGYARRQLLGARVELLLDEGVQAGHRSLREAFVREPSARPMGAGRDLSGRHQSGARVPVEIGLTPLRLGEQTFVLATVVDLSERTRAEERVQASLSEKEFLLRELHHRARNNLQLIASILHLAASQPERPVLDILTECRERIGAISLVHDQLYQSGTFTSLSIHEYLSVLSEQVALGWRRSGGVLVELAPGELSLPLDKAIPLGLAVNELLTNAFKHAFVGRERGLISVGCLRDPGGTVTLWVRDDGVGMGASAPSPGAHVGLELVRALARQLRASIDVETSAGTSVTLRFEA